MATNKQAFFKSLNKNEDLMRAVAACLVSAEWLLIHQINGVLQQYTAGERTNYSPHIMNVRHISSQVEIALRDDARACTYVASHRYTDVLL